MPAIAPGHLVETILDAIEQSGYSSVLVSGLRQHPRKFAVTIPEGGHLHLWVYAWTLTHGGRPSLPNEYRIQMTTVRSPLAENPNGPTILVGVEPNLGVFGGFDLLRHRRFTTGSPSVQIDVRTVRQSLQDGLAFDRKNNEEIAIGFRPDQFMTYVLNAEALHRLGTDARTFSLLNRAAAREDLRDDDIAVVRQDRRRIVQVVSRLSRLANFREQVRNAYGQRCAVARIQLRLVDAAHILPVGAPTSVDDVRNGIALSPTFHRAYDNGLIFLDESYQMRVNPQKEAALAALNLTGGLTEFRASLGRIHLPADKRQWPDSRFINKANEFRGISA